MAGTWLRRLAGVAAACGALVAGACGGGVDGSTLPASGDDEAASAGATLTVTFDITGDATVRGSATMPAATSGLDAPTCANFARGNDVEGKVVFAVPSLVGTDGSVGGHQVSVEALIRDYTGPGSYGQDALSGFANPANILVDNQRQYAIPPDGTRTQVVTDASGSGTWTFARLTHNDGSGTVADIAGTIRWTCHDG
jgi:hypothetical protein